MIKVEDALMSILENIRSLNSEIVKLPDSLGRVLSEEVYADRDIPCFDNSAMDGYAVRASDTVGASKSSPKILSVIENLRAGYVAKRQVEAKQAIRTMTGAVIPKGADSVVIVEDTDRQGRDSVKIFKEVVPGENIRRTGEDVRKQELIISKGTLLNFAHIGMLATLGKAKVEVTRKPMVAILATGDEVVELGRKLKPGRIYNCNTYTLYSQVLDCGGIPKNLGVARDKPQELKKKIRSALNCDLILTSGGVSVGDYDLVKFVLAKMGTNIRFWQVAMRPGKPLVFGMLKNIPIFGLPGNSVSSIISFEIFVRPTILRMLGQSIDTRKQVDAILEENIRKKKGLMYFLRAKTRWEDGVYLTRPIGPQGSGILKSLVLADSWIILGEEDEFVEKGRRVTVRFL